MKLMKLAPESQRLRRMVKAFAAGELDRIAAAARARHTTARVALRINPDVAADSHPHIATGRSIHKFGVPIRAARAIPRHAGARSAPALGDPEHRPRRRSPVMGASHREHRYAAHGDRERHRCGPAGGPRGESAHGDR